MSASLNSKEQGACYCESHMKRTKVLERKQTGTQLVLFLNKRRYAYHTYLYLLHCVKINYVYFIMKLCCDQLWTRVSLSTKHDDRDTLVHRSVL